MSSKISHEELIQRFPALQQIEESIRKHVLDVFANAENGEPNAISRAGCLALALKSNEVGRAVGEDKTHVLWNAWRNAFPTKGGNANRVDFSGVHFRKVPLKPNLSFAAMEFGDFANFRAAQFDYSPIFKAAQFGHLASFTAVRFRIGVNFTAAQFGDLSDFSGAQFGPFAIFTAVQFGLMANFKAACFMSRADFSARTRAQIGEFYGERLQTLEQWADMHGLSPETFKNIDFSGAVFAGQVDFSDRRFLGATAFGILSSDFTYADLKRDEKKIPILDSEGNWLTEERHPKQLHVSFGRAPVFHGCELHQDTSFEGAKFPPDVGKAEGTESAARAYRTLKLAFNKQQAVREEKRFFRLEMEEETLRETGLKRLLFWLYKWSSDYGFSIARPLLLFVVAWLGFAPIYGYSSGQEVCWLWHTGCDWRWDWLSFSFQQALPLPGFDKPKPGIDGVSVAWVAFHKTISLSALFLIGLALRNLFKLK